MHLVGLKDIWAVRISLWIFLTSMSLAAGEAAGMLQLWEEEQKDYSVKNLNEFSFQEKISIPSAGISSPLVFPESEKMAILKEALKKGPVHYPKSPLPSSGRGNTFIFGHSSDRPRNNPALNVFSGLKKVVPGDKIEIWFRQRVYVYEVEKIKILKPNEAEIYLETPKRMLTLSTCWPVGDPTNRFIVEANFVRSYPQQSF